MRATAVTNRRMASAHLENVIDPLERGEVQLAQLSVLVDLPSHAHMR